MPVRSLPFSDDMALTLHQQLDLGDDGLDIHPEALDGHGMEWQSPMGHGHSFDHVFGNAFVRREPSAAVPQDAQIWTKFGELGQEERMTPLEDIDLLPDPLPESPPNYYPSSEDGLFEGIDDDLLRALEPDVEDEILAPVADETATPVEEVIEVKEEAPDTQQLSKTLIVELPESLLLMPRSCYEPFEPDVPIVRERIAFDALFEAAKQAGQDIDGFVEFQLDDFAIYCDRPRYPEEMCSLHNLDTKSGFGDFFFDGKLSVGDTAFFVRRIRIAALPIDNYGTLSKHTVRSKIWLQSAFNASREVYYRLNRPAKEYRRFFDPFLWVADLAKHFVDYLKVMGESHLDVTIFHFRATFGSWLVKTHGKAPVFVSWRKQFPSDDFRSAIVANLGFLHKEAIGVLGARKTYKHTLWAEIWEFRRYQRYPAKEEKPRVRKKKSWIVESSTESSLDGATEDQTSADTKNSSNNNNNNNKDSPPTIVTQYMYDCFSHLPFGDRLEAMPLSQRTKTMRNELIRKRHLELPAPLHTTAKTISTAETQQIRDIQPGDTISTQRDGEESGTKWRRDISHGFHDVDRWLALVQRVHVDKRGRRSFDVIWYYRPVDTLCGLMKYPWNNELFLSDHCSCGETSKIRESEVLGVHNVEFGGTSATTAEFFCRQTYICAERKWIALEKDHMLCSHTTKTPKAPEFEPGETRLVILERDTGRSEPCEFVTSYEEDGSDIYRFRRLLRRGQVDQPNAPLNELVYSENLVEVKRRRVLEPCFVRFFKVGQEIPTPYDRDGVGGFFYITHQETHDQDTGTRSYVPLEVFPNSLKQGFDPSEPIQRLRGLDLFCGGGNFGRGLEDGGGIEMRWANDFNEKAMHTYMANTSAPGAVSPFLGSIDDLQRLAIQGEFADNVPEVGSVDFISGGSPCPGFSLLTNDKTTIAQRKNQSLVAAFGSFIDLYRPRYGLLENVPGIVQRKSNRDQDVFSQLICAIVGLGYQTHFFFLDASAYGSPQRRARVFLSFAAPGHRLPRRPHPTHAHPLNTRPFSLGNLPTGEPMAERTMPEATPFNFISAQAATANLPPVYDSKPDICVPFPDHRISLGATRQLRNKINLISTRPYGTNFAQAWYGPDRKKAGSGVLTPAERLVFPADTGRSMNRSSPGSNAYGRQRPDRLIETIVTSQSPSDAKNGRTLHWREDRVLTIMEARRAQGFRDHEVILGLPTDQYRVVGNSVAREVAVSLGAVFREVWAQSLADERRDMTRLGVEVSPAVKVEIIPSDIETPRSRSRSSRAESTPTTTPPPPPSSGSKRQRRTSIAIEIRASKTSKTERDDSPGRGTPGSAQGHRPSRLRESVTLDHE